MVYTVYADVLWAINFLLDLAILWATARFCCVLTSWPRLLLAAALGAFYGVGLLFPALAPLYALPVVFLLSVLLLLAAFGFLPWRRFAWLLASFYLISALMGGLVLALRSLLGWGLGERAAAVWLLPALLLAAGAARLGVGGFRQMLRRFGLLSRVEIYFDGQKVCLSCFLDTGNNLRDSIQKRPVMLVELAALRKVLPAALWHHLAELYQKEGENARPYQVWLNCQSFEWSNRLLLLPFSSVGESHGLLLGFVPEKLQFQLADGRNVECAQEIVLGISPLPLRGLKGCRAIIHPEAILADDALIETGYEAAKVSETEDLQLLPVSARQPVGALIEIEMALVDLYKERDLA